MNKDSIDDVSEIINEKLEKIYNSSVVMANISLLNHYKDDPKTWKSRQIQDIAKLKQETATLVKKNSKDIMNSITAAILLCYKIADGSFKDIDTEKKVVEVRANKNIDKVINSVQKQVIKRLNQLPNSIGRYQNKNITKVYNSIISTKKYKDLDNLYTEIEKYAGKVEQPYYIDSLNRKTNFNDGMTRYVRTEMQNETRTLQVNASRDAGLIFYLCSSHSDCANDHVDYQGKIYVDEDWESIITDENIREQVADYIAMNRILTMQEIQDAPYYLNTRPNCRHYFIPMNTNEVLTTSVSKMLKENGMIKGEYDKQNYIDLQKQRYYERTIRKAKSSVEEAEKKIQNTPAGSDRKEAEKELLRSKSIISNNRAKLRELTSKNPTLERDYDRENPKLILKDLGYRYSVKYYKNQ